MNGDISSENDNSYDSDNNNYRFCSRIINNDDKTPLLPKKNTSFFDFEPDT